MDYYINQVIDGFTYVGNEKWRKQIPSGYKYCKLVTCCVCGKDLFRGYFDVLGKEDTSACKGTCTSLSRNQSLKKEYEIGKTYIVDENTIRIYNGPKNWLYKSKTKCSYCGKELYRDRPERTALNFCDGFCDFAYNDPLGATILDRIDTPMFCYLMGLVATDGTMGVDNNTVSVTLTFHDLSILKNIKKRLGGQVYRSLKRGSADNIMATWMISNSKFYEYVKSIGIINNKSLVLDVCSYFSGLCDDNKWHFIRGCIDGDGCIYIDHKNNIGISFVSGSIEFINMVDAFLKKYHKGTATIKQHRTAKTYSLQFYHKNALLVLPKLYANKEDSFFLDRKYYKVAKFLGDESVYYKQAFFDQYKDDTTCKVLLKGYDLCGKDGRKVIITNELDDADMVDLRAKLPESVEYITI